MSFHRRGDPRGGKEKSTIKHKTNPIKSNLSSSRGDPRSKKFRKNKYIKDNTNTKPDNYKRGGSIKGDIEKRHHTKHGYTKTNDNYVKFIKETEINEPTKETEINEPTKETEINEPTKETEINEPTKETEINEPTKETEINDEKSYHKLYFNTDTDIDSNTDNTDIDSNTDNSNDNSNDDNSNDDNSNNNSNNDDNNIQDGDDNIDDFSSVYFFIRGEDGHYMEVNHSKLKFSNTNILSTESDNVDIIEHVRNNNMHSINNTSSNILSKSNHTQKKLSGSNNPSRRVNNHREIRRSNRSNNTHETSRRSNNTHETSRRSNNTHETRRSNNTHETSRRSNNTHEIRRSNNTHETRRSNNPKETRRSNNPKETRRSNNPKETRRSNNPKETRRSNNTRGSNNTHVSNNKSIRSSNTHGSNNRSRTSNKSQVKFNRSSRSNYDTKIKSIRDDNNKNLSSKSNNHKDITSDSSKSKYSQNNNLKKFNTSNTPTNISTTLSSLDLPLQMKDQLGKGGFGTIYNCYNDKGGHYAMKVIENKKDNPMEGLPCLIEASIMASINHPLINSAVAIDYDYGMICILMEVAPYNLNKWRRKCNPSMPLIYKVCYDILHAVHYLHCCNIIHGDLKAGNILMFGNQIKLTDFSLTLKSNWNNTGKSIATVSHRPFEILCKEPYSIKADMWGLGCTFFQVVYGYILFQYQYDISKIEGISSISREDARGASINALHDWSIHGYGGQIPTYQANGKTDTPYLKVRFPNKWRQGTPLNSLSIIDQIIISLLQNLQENRPSSTKLLKNPSWKLKISKKYIIEPNKYKILPSLDSQMGKLVSTLSLKQRIMIGEIEQEIELFTNSKDIKRIAISLVYKLSDDFIINISQNTISPLVGIDKNMINMSIKQKNTDTQTISQISKINKHKKRQSDVYLRLLRAGILWIAIKLVSRDPPKNIKEYLEKYSLDNIHPFELFEMEIYICNELSWRLHHLE